MKHFVNSCDNWENPTKSKTNFPFKKSLFIREFFVQKFAHPRNNYDHKK